MCKRKDWGGERKVNPRKSNFARTSAIKKIPYGRRLISQFFYHQRIRSGGSLIAVSLVHSFHKQEKYNPYTILQERGRVLSFGMGLKGFLSLVFLLLRASFYRNNGGDVIGRLDLVRLRNT